MARPKKLKIPDASPEPKASDVVSPLIRSNGESHILEDLFDGPVEEMPLIKSVGYSKLGGRSGWISYTITTRGREVVSIEVSEPDLKDIAEETAKIAFVQAFIDKEAW